MRDKVLSTNEAQELDTIVIGYDNWLIQNCFGRNFIRIWMRPSAQAETPLFCQPSLTTRWGEPQKTQSKARGRRYEESTSNYYSLWKTDTVSDLARNFPFWEEIRKSFRICAWEFVGVGIMVLVIYYKHLIKLFQYDHNVFRKLARHTCEIKTV